MGKNWRRGQAENHVTNWTVYSKVDIREEESSYCYRVEGTGQRSSESEEESGGSMMDDGNYLSFRSWETHFKYSSHLSS